MKTLTVIQHTSAEYLGLMEDHFEGRRIRFTYIRPFTEGVAAPDPDAIADGLVLLGGGPWGSAGERDLPTLGPEVAIARTCLMLEKPLIGIGLGAQILALAAGGSVEATPLRFTLDTARRCVDGALNGYLPDAYPFAVYGRDRAVPPGYSQILARDSAGAPALWQVGANAFGFSGHPGLKVAMIEDLIMEFEEAPADPVPDLRELRAAQRAMEDALVPIMTGLVQMTGLMQAARD